MLHLKYCAALLAAILANTAIGKKVPDNLNALITSIKAGGACKNALPGNFYASDSGQPTFRYCNDHIDQGIIYLKGPNGQLADMDVDCDGRPNSICSGGGDTQGQTSFQDQVSQFGIPDLNAAIHDYVVFGNENGENKPNWPVIDVQKYGIRPLSIMAVFYGVWGDTNGSDGDHALVGEASIALARHCFGNGMTEDSGHDQTDVMYIAFTGDGAVPGASGAAWKASTSDEFQNNQAFNALGDKLVGKLHA
ncbi:hypothetical protein H2200_003460 [Cladophialophora chaetospira]|uniref:Endo-chitosanase n=1 Tax=Cladophialophora chaetospira TaxID=386627 RepID=A0AA39CMS0_9EURO|nr:hypothetical protein H2200_003460 [Cladophialophora chaetospira]